MPRYFFNILDRQMSPDDTGTECSDVPAARAEAVRATGQMLQEAAERVRQGQDWVMEVLDDRGHVLFIVRVAVEDRADPERSLQR